MSSDRVLIRATNQRAGGGVQVAASFLDEVALVRRSEHRFPWLDHAHFWVSTAVFDSLTPASVHELRPHISDPKPWQRLPSQTNYRVSFAVFGPEYRPHPHADVHLAGYADGRSVYEIPDGELLTKAEVIRWRVRGLASRAAIRRADELVVESASFREVLRQKWRIKAPIHLVPNVVNGVFAQPDLWEKVALPRRRPGDLVLTYVTRAYSHKNLEFLPKLRKAALARGEDLRFWVTLTDDEWAGLSAEFRDACDNVGPLRVAQVPTLLAAGDGGIFPSLLESFSASPLELFAMGRPCFASDRPFVRDSCGDAPCYIDPLNPGPTVDRILSALGNQSQVNRMIDLGREVLARLPSARERALAYLNLIDNSYGRAR